MTKTLAALAFIISMAVGADETQSPSFGVVAHPDNTSHLDPGVAMPENILYPFFPSRASTDGRLLKPEHFEDPETCGGCHQKIYAEWRGSMHSNAWVDPVYRAALKLVSKASDGKADKFCMGCHTPIGLVTGEATPSGERMSNVAERGVHCEVCHNISRSTGIGNGAFVLTPRLHGRPLKFGPFKDAVSPYHDTAYSKLHTQSEFCAQCHDVTHPFNRLPLERTYTEWRDSPYAGEGVQCQDCHMKPVRGAATPFSKERERVYTHDFVGGNALVPRLLGHEGHAERAEAMLRSAARIEIHADETLVPGKMNTIRVRVWNVGAGHKLPTGFPEGREMWLDFRMLDEAGRTLYRLGAIKNGHTEEGAKSFKVVLGDKNNNIVDVNILDADRILYDTRIEPKGYRDVSYMVELPDDARGFIRLEVDLNYWSFSQEMLDHLLGEDAPRAHITTMAQEEKTVVIAEPDAQDATALEQIF